MNLTQSLSLNLEFLYQVSIILLIQIQARTWPCNRVTCICGITIREENDVIRINECDQPRNSHTSPTVEKATELREGTVVQRSTDGHDIMVCGDFFLSLCCVIVFLRTLKALVTDS